MDFCCDASVHCPQPVYRTGTPVRGIMNLDTTNLNVWVGYPPNSEQLTFDFSTERQLYAVFYRLFNCSQNTSYLSKLMRCDKTSGITSLLDNDTTRR